MIRHSAKPRLSAIATIAFAISLLTGACASQPPSELDAELRFEAGKEGEQPVGWGGGPSGTLFLDTETMLSGEGAARINRDGSSAQAFSSFTKMVPMDFSGQGIELTGSLRTQDVDGSATLWMRLDGSAGSLGFVNLRGEAPSGSTEWTRYSVELPHDIEARELYFGFLLEGTGTVWADDLELLVDGRPIWNAEPLEREPTVLETDTEFTGGSRVPDQELSTVQVEHLATLARIWGFVKYHHPAVAAGSFHWDYELFRVLPQILSSATSAQRDAVLLEWLERIGQPGECSPCATLPDDLHLTPDLAWIETTDFTEPLRQRLEHIHANRFAGDTSFYLRLVPGVGNPVFDNELDYASLGHPDLGFRLLALFRFWNVIEYWFPYRDLLDDDWHDVLIEFIPRLAAASTVEQYKLELIALIALVKDTHANLWNGLDVRPPTGDCELPIAVRFVDTSAVVSAVRDGAGELARGDVITRLDGRTTDELVEEWSPYYAASNVPTRLRDIARSLTRGRCGPAELVVERRTDSGAGSLDLQVSRVPVQPPSSPPTHDRPGETFQRLSEDVAYLKLSSVEVAEVPKYIESADGAKGLIVDIRNYPSEFVVFALGGQLLEESTAFARFTAGNPHNPGAFSWTQPIEIAPAEPGWDADVVILIDEISQSQAEYTAMALRAGPRATVIGSTTAGADGNVSPIPLPGGLRSLISGIGVFYPDKTPTQRVGIVPDIVAKPTIEGLRDGRDEILEAALRHLLGDTVGERTVRELAKAP